MKHVINKLFICVGIVCLVGGGLLVVDRYIPVLDTAPVTTTVLPQDNTPVRVAIESLSIDLPVVGVEQNTNGSWPTTGKGVAYDTNSAVPGTPGTVVMYGHDWPRLLGNLRHIHRGNAITVTKADGSIVTYYVSRIYNVRAQSQITYTSDGQKLIMYTCDGVMDTSRLVVEALIP